MCTNAVTIFLADDDLDDQFLIMDAIYNIDASINIKTFNDGQEVINYLNSTQREEPCLIVLDYNMPLMSGLQVLENIADDTRLKTVPRIVWSTSNSAQHKDQCLKSGASRYVVKPNDLHTYNLIARDLVNTCCSRRIGN
jgi:CheY-like chemotaxis protein